MHIFKKAACPCFSKLQAGTLSNPLYHTSLHNKYTNWNSENLCLMKKKHFEEVRWPAVSNLETDFTLCKMKHTLEIFVRLKQGDFISFRLSPFLFVLLCLFLPFFWIWLVSLWVFFFFVFVLEAESYIKTNSLKSSRSLAAALVTLIKIKDRLDIKLLKGSSHGNWKYPIRRDRQNNPFSPQKYQRYCWYLCLLPNISNNYLSTTATFSNMFLTLQESRE